MTEVRDWHKDMEEEKEKKEKTVIVGHGGSRLNKSKLIELLMKSHSLDKEEEA